MCFHTLWKTFAGTEETATVVSGFTHWNVLFQVQDEYKREVYQDLNTHTLDIEMLIENSQVFWW